MELSPRHLDAAIAAAKVRCPWAKSIQLSPAEPEPAAIPTRTRFPVIHQRFAICVTVHEPYLRFLGDCLPIWNAQAPHADKFLVCDGCEPPETEPWAKGWTFIQGTFGHPSKARNAVLNQTEADWIWYWDADNRPYPHAYRTGLEAATWAADDVGVLYPGGRTGDPRLNYLVDTGSLWRTRALRHVGGWPVSWLEDWVLTNRLAEFGWKLQPLENLETSFRYHPEQRRNLERFENKLWSARSLGVITLFRGDRKLLDLWEGWLHHLSWPKHGALGLTVVDDSGNNRFRNKLNGVLRRAAAIFPRITVIDSGGVSLPPNVSGRTRNDRVGRLYNQALRSTPEQMILTWEDDVMPSECGAVFELCKVLALKQQRAGVSALYRSRRDPELAVGSLDPDDSCELLRLADWADADPARIELIGGGFTVWNRAALELCPVLGSRGGLGWDGYLCERLNQAGWTVWIHGGVHCAHLIDE